MRTSRVRGDQRGQTTVVVLPVLMALILVVAMVANVGQAVNRRVALQIVADAGAYSGATYLATGMNRLADDNYWIQVFWEALGISSFQWNFGPSCFADWFNAGMYSYWAGKYAVDLVDLNASIGGEIRDISDLNARDLFPGEALTYEGGIVGALGVPTPLITPPVDDGTDPEVGIGWPSAEKGFKSWTCVIWYYPYIQGMAFFVSVNWFKLQTIGAPYHFLWRVKAPPTQAYMFDGFFGPLPEMEAIALAKPVGGHIEKGESDYRAKMKPVNTLLFQYLLEVLH